MKRLDLFIFLLILFSSCGTGRKYILQNSLIEKSPNVILYENTAETNGPCNPSVAINPEDTEMMIVGSASNYVHRSMDGGYTWTTRNINSDQGVSGSPSVIAGKNGNFYYFHYGNQAQNSMDSVQMYTSIVVQKSKTNGLTWTDGTLIETGQSTQFLNPQATINPKNNDLYLSWTEVVNHNSDQRDCTSTIVFSRSEDGGNSWTKPIQISQYEGNCLNDDMTVIAGPPSVNADGDIYITYAYNNKIYFDKSTDRGKSWLDEDLIVADQDAGWSFNVEGVKSCNGLPVTAVDRSKSPYADRIYISYGDVKNGNADIYLTWSDDEGISWSEAVKVNQDHEKDQFLPRMSVDPIDGQVYVVFYDRADIDDIDSVRYDVNLAYSTDGGMKFKQKKISNTPSYAPGKKGFGDYINIATLNGMIRPVWTHFNGKKLSVRMALINRKAMQ